MGQNRTKSKETKWVRKGEEEFENRSDCRNKKKIQFKGKQVMSGERKKNKKQKQTIIKQID